MNIYSKVKGLAGINSIEYFLTDSNNLRVSHTYSSFDEETNEVDIFVNSAVDNVAKTKSLNFINFDTINFNGFDDIQQLKTVNIITDKAAEDSSITLAANEITLNTNILNIVQDKENYNNIKINGKKVTTEHNFRQYTNPKLTKADNKNYIAWEQVLDLKFTHVPFIQIHESISDNNSNLDAIIKLAAIRFVDETPQKIVVRFDEAVLKKLSDSVPELQGPASIAAGKYVMQVFGKFE